MSTSPMSSAQRGVILTFGVAIIALVVDLVVTITGASATSAFIVGALAFIAGAMFWLAAKRRGEVPPLLFGGWMLGWAAFAWAIGLLAGQ